MNILEGGVGVFTVRLATQPAANVSVAVSPTERDDDQRCQRIDLVDSRRYRGFSCDRQSGERNSADRNADLYHHSSITVTSLGRMFYTGNNNTHSLKVVFGSNGADVPGGGTSLNLSGGTAGKFKYALLSGPLTLAANTSYYVVSLAASGGDKWATSDTQVTPTTAATCDGAILSKPNGWGFRLPANTTFDRQQPAPRRTSDREPHQSGKQRDVHCSREHQPDGHCHRQ